MFSFDIFNIDLINYMSFGIEGLCQIQKPLLKFGSLVAKKIQPCQKSSKSFFTISIADEKLQTNLQKSFFTQCWCIFLFLFYPKS